MALFLTVSRFALTAIAAFLPTMLKHRLFANAFLVVTDSTVALSIVATVISVIFFGPAFVTNRGATPSGFALVVVIATLSI